MVRIGIGSGAELQSGGAVEAVILSGEDAAIVERRIQSLAHLLELCVVGKVADAGGVGDALRRAEAGMSYGQVGCGIAVIGENQISGSIVAVGGG